MRDPAVIASRPRPERHGPSGAPGADTTGAAKARRRASWLTASHLNTSGRRRSRACVILYCPKHRKSLPGMNERPTARSGLGQQAESHRLRLPELSQKLVALNDLTAPQLRAEWRRLYRGQPPRLSRDLLVLQHRLSHPGIGPGRPQQGDKGDSSWTKVLQLNEQSPTMPKSLPGARLVREWRGRTHTVQVTEDGFDMMEALFVAVQDRPCDHRRALVRSQVLHGC